MSAVEAFVARTTKASGVPMKLEDPVAIGDFVDLMRDNASPKAGVPLSDDHGVTSSDDLDPGEATSDAYAER